MSVFRNRKVFVLLALAVLAAPSLQATMVLKMDLGEMCARAGNIFRGTVISITESSVSVGGGTLDTLIYRLRVAEEFKGEFEEKDGVKYIDVQMLAPGKDSDTGNIRRFSKLPELPQLRVGSEYLLLTTPPSSGGLSSPVGLGQGCFGIASHGKTETALNEVGNQGLYDGPVSYSTLANDIRAALGR